MRGVASRVLTHHCVPNCNSSAMMRSTMCGRFSAAHLLRARAVRAARKCGAFVVYACAASAQR
eukprot:3365194-Lingulodinium_polyedra.AAC.1